MKLHIGCGSKYLEGYDHVDIRPYPHVKYITQADHLSMIADESVEEIYACHILEHFPREAMRDGRVLREWNRVLVPGGILRIAVPDFEAIAALYQEKGDLEVLLGLLYGGQNYQYNYHYQAYDFKRIASLLNSAGFSNVQRYNWQEFLPEGYDDYSRSYLPHMDFANGRLMSLNIIASKGN